MPKESGVGIDALYVDGYDLSGDVGSVQTIAQRRNLLEVPGLNVAAMERIGGLQDGELSFNSWFNTASSQEHEALSTLPTTDRTVMYFHNATVGSPAAALRAKQIDYQMARGQDGSLALTVQALANGSSVEWGDQLTTGKQSFGAAGNGTSFDYTAVSTAFGAVAHLQIFSFTGTSVTVTIADSADNGSFTPITGLGFTTSSGRMAQRLATATTATIRRYVRVQLTGIFSATSIAVVFKKFDVAQT